MINLSQFRFEKIVDDAVAKVPKKFLNKLNNVAIVVQDYPDQEQLKSLGVRRHDRQEPARPYLLLGLYHGVPQIKRWGGGGILPDKITIFKKPIEHLSDSEEDVKRIVRDTVKHEIAHHFGMSEADLRRIGRQVLR